MKGFERVDEGHAYEAAAVRAPNPFFNELDISAFDRAEKVTCALAEAGGGGDFIDGVPDFLLAVFEAVPFRGHIAAVSQAEKNGHGFPEGLPARSPDDVESVFEFWVRF